MIPIGEVMAEALLESDDSTASLSGTSTEHDSFEGGPTVTPSRLSQVVPFKPRNRQRGDRSKCIKPVSLAKRPQSQSLLSRDLQPSLAMPQYVALDCEMVGVGPYGRLSVLARVSLVDYFGKCLLDTFIRVEEKVTDLRHHVTGITRNDLTSNAAMPFGKCRQRVINLIRNKILVGHALDNDLAVLGILHPWQNIRDTSTFYLYQKTNKYGVVGPSRLRDLAKFHLGLDIQRSGQAHCPCEDACAAMALYRQNQMEFDYLVECQRQTAVLRSRMGGAFMRH